MVTLDAQGHKGAIEGCLVGCLCYSRPLHEYLDWAHLLLPRRRFVREQSRAAVS